MQTKVLTLGDKESILNLERSLLSEDDFMAEWHAPWREESLDFYLPNGWNYGIYNDGKLSAYFIAQPILFLQGYVQSLWIEHLCAPKEEEKNYLLEVAYRASREKHLQKLLFNKNLVKSLSLSKHIYIGEEDTFFSMSTTKMSEP